MTREQWLEQKHRDLDKQIWQIRDDVASHATVVDLKKQKLLIKEELLALRRPKNG